MSEITIERLEPFAVGYLTSPVDNVEYRIANGMKCRAENMPIGLSEQDIFATFLEPEYAGIRYKFGAGIIVAKHQLNERRKKYPQFTAEIDKIDAAMSPLATERLIAATRTPKDQALWDAKAMWAGDWVGHANPDYHMFLHLGTRGLRERNEHCRAKNPDNDSFYDALNLVLDGLEALSVRTKAQAEEIRSKTSDQAVKARMSRLISAFENIPFNPPKDFFEAVQMFWLGFSFDGVDSPGRFDYAMEDYYLLSPEAERKEILEELWQLFKKYRTWNLCIGGSDENGNDYSNQLTYDILEVAKKYKYNTPNLTMRVHKNTPEGLLQSAAETIATGIGMPVLYNDEVVCPALEELGIPKYDAHQYCMNGCNQIDIFGKSHMGLEDGEVCLAKCLELTLHSGYSPKHERQMGLKTGEVEGFADFKALMSAYFKQVEYVTDVAVRLSNAAQKIFAEFAPNPIRSNLIQGCAEKGKDYKNGGPIYGHGQILAEGIADTADSLAAIKHFCFDEKKYSLKILVDALKCDFQGFDELYRDFSGYSKFGNDISEVDEIAAEIVKHYNEYLLTKQTFRGGVFGGGCSPYNRAAGYGMGLGAMPNGKLMNDTLLADSIGATPGQDEFGPTALLNSVMCFDQTKAKSGFVLNLKFNKALFNTADGKAAFINLAKTYFANGGQQLSVSVVSTEELKDALSNPEKHKDLIVRVGGYSDYFNNLSLSLKENIIARSELLL